MADLTRLDDLKVLECALQDRLHAHLGRVVPFQVQCIFKEGVLWVLAQHAAEVVVDTQETFRVLEKTLQAEQPGNQLPVKLYLRKSGDKQPYSMENFTIYPSVKERISREAAPAIDETELNVPESEPDLSPENTPAQAEISAEPEIGADERASANVAAAVVPTAAAAGPVDEEEVNRAKDILDRLALDDSSTPSATPEPEIPVAEATLTDEATLEQDLFRPTTSNNSDLSKAEEAEAFANDIQSSFAYTDGQKPRPSLKKWLIGGGVGLLAIAGTGFGLSRPCVMGSCPQIEQSRSLAIKSLETIGRPSTGKEILDAQEDLHKSIEKLKTVPFWSSSYGKAQEKIKQYSVYAEHLDVAVAGMKKASQASSKTSKQPVAQATWKESQKLWSEAIAELQKVPSDSKIYPLAQQKLQEYQQKLDVVNQNITSEVNADKNLASAKAIATTNAAKQAQAKTLEEWQGADKEWKSFEQLVATVPDETTAHSTAQKLLQEYTPQIAAARAKLTKEKTHGETFKKAESAAADAKKLSQEKKYPESLASWNTAISTLQNIPEDSTYQSKAQTTLTEYNKSMKIVESSIVGDQKKTQADASLKKICDGKPAVCSYTIEGKTITVKLLPEYTKKVQQTATDATKQGDDNAKVGLIKHVSSLGDALESVSNTSVLTLQLYGADGKLIQKYTPKNP
jgi:hypothetical protein